MSLSGSAHSELTLFLGGEDSPVPWQEDRGGTWRTNTGVRLAQLSHQHQALRFVQTLKTGALLRFVQTLKTGALPILNTRRETLEDKCAMWFPLTQAHPHSLPNAFEDVEEGKASWCNRNLSDCFYHLENSLEFLI